MSQGTIPPYQPVDILLGRDKTSVPPIPGWVIIAPDSGIQAELIEKEADVPAALERVKTKSKWPAQIFARPCWIHAGETVGGVTNIRRYWTPR